MAQKQNRSRYAILGILCYQPMSGYDIQKFFTDIAGFWQESYGQIYPNLRLLLQEGLVSKQVEERDKGPSRHLYTLTATGRQALQAWLQETAEPLPIRNELLLKLIFGHEAGEEATRRQLETYRAQITADVGNLHIVEAWQEAQMDEGDPHARYRRMAVRYALHTSQALLTWCDECLAELNGD
ncbi:MAG TPA: PadR family transcriptional regulator [Chloroflexota bacterium]|nr:PadR family transcriptional regulator [Chloroflexota bacterium]HUM71699.1 PadR family transcriptional regulator [Chloroflexota bacterium]